MNQCKTLVPNSPRVKSTVIERTFIWDRSTRTEVDGKNFVFWFGSSKSSSTDVRNDSTGSDYIWSWSINWNRSWAWTSFSWISLPFSKIVWFLIVSTTYSFSRNATSDIYPRGTHLEYSLFCRTISVSLSLCGWNLMWTKWPSEEINIPNRALEVVKALCIIKANEADLIRIHGSGSVLLK